MEQAGGMHHESVLPNEVMEVLSPQAGEVFVDLTLGGGGHARLLLEKVPNLRLIGIDRDLFALGKARQKLANFGDRVSYHHARYSEFEEVLRSLDITQVDGFLLDLGVSSFQFDDGSRGFSFQKEGAIDMRMDPTQGPTALDVIRDLDVIALGTILRDLGEEKFFKKISNALKVAVKADELHTTLDLANCVSAAIPEGAKRLMRIHPATLTFQALRIFVNRELEELEKFLANFLPALKVGGRCAIISFHSLEDRRVKYAFRDLAWSSSLPPKYALEAGERVHPLIEILTRKPLEGGEDEVARNPRARSAKLRACKKLHEEEVSP